MQIEFNTSGLSKLTTSHNRLISTVQGSQTAAAKISSFLADRMNALYESKKTAMNTFQTDINKNTDSGEISKIQSRMKIYESQISVLEGNFSQSVEQMQNNTQSITSYVQDLSGIVKVIQQTNSTMASQLAKQI